MEPSGPTVKDSMRVELVGRAWMPLFATTGAVIGAIIASRRCRAKLELLAGWLMERLDLCRRSYIRSRRPSRIILMRHAESEGNVDKGVYTSTPDHALKLTEIGRQQATAAGLKLKELIGDESVYFIVSPYTRTRITYNLVRQALGPRKWAMKEDPRLRELDFGNFQDEAAMRKTMETRKAYGRFWFRFMNGESGADVYDRATAFWESVFRSMDNASADHRFCNYVIVTHGLMMWKVEFFEKVWNPTNCETWVMERDERGSFRVVTEIVKRRRGWETPPPGIPASQDQRYPCSVLPQSCSALDEGAECEEPAAMVSLSRASGNIDSPKSASSPSSEEDCTATDNPCDEAEDAWCPTRVLSQSVDRKAACSTDDDIDITDEDADVDAGLEEIPGGYGDIDLGMGAGEGVIVRPLRSAISAAREQRSGREWSTRGGAKTEGPLTALVKRTK